LEGKSEHTRTVTFCVGCLYFFVFPENGKRPYKARSSRNVVVVVVVVLFDKKRTLKNAYFCRTVAIDMRGYGDSEKPSGVEHYAMDHLVSDVKQVVEALGLY
jgi:hypothetical protein